MVKSCGLSRTIELYGLGGTKISVGRLDEGLNPTWA